MNGLVLRCVSITHVCSGCKRGFAPFAGNPSVGVVQDESFLMIEIDGMHGDGIPSNLIRLRSRGVVHAGPIAVLVTGGMSAGLVLLRGGVLTGAILAFLVVAALIALAMMTPRTLVIDVASGTWQQIGPLRIWNRGGALSAFDTILVTRRRRPHWSGEWIAVADIALVGPRAHLNLLDLGPETQRLDTAHELAFRLHLPVRIVGDAASIRSPAFDRILLSVLWTAVAGVTLATLAISLRRPAGGTAAIEAQRPDMNRYAASQLMNRARSRYRYGDARGAEQDLREILGRYPSWPDAHNLLAYALADQDKLVEALKEAQMALAMRPSDGNILDTVAEMHERRREYRQAATYYEMALAAEDPADTLETHFKYGRTLLALGRIKEARDHLAAVARARDPYWAQAARKLLASPAAKPHSNAPSSTLPARKGAILFAAEGEDREFRRAEQAGTAAPSAETP